MPARIDIDLTDSEIAAMGSIPAASWFTRFVFRNAASPVHPAASLDVNHDMKKELVDDWIAHHVRGRRVLDLFAANGAFSFSAALAGASEVVGLDFSAERIECAEFVAGVMRPRVDCRMSFIQGDVYHASELFDEPFDVVLCLGGLYHVADPALVLRLIGGLATERLILQTSQVLNGPGNRARFVVRKHDRTAAGMTSIRGGYGTWYCSAGCLRELVLHGGFRIAEERRPPLLKRRRFPWYAAICEPA